MKKEFPEVVEAARTNNIAPYQSNKGDRFGLFLFRYRGKEFMIMAVAALQEGDMITEDGWDHVSVSTQGNHAKHPPTWEDMCYFKDLFFESDECVIQYHPPKSAYVNTMDRCLHLWRPANGFVPMPPQECV